MIQRARKTFKQHCLIIFRIKVIIKIHRTYVYKHFVSICIYSYLTILKVIIRQVYTYSSFYLCHSIFATKYVLNSFLSDLRLFGLVCLPPNLAV